MVESYNEHAYSDANQAAALRFLAAQWGVVAGPLPQVKEIPADQLVCTRTGQISTDFADWVPLTEEIRLSSKSIPLTPARLRALYIHARSVGPAAEPILPDNGKETDDTMRWKLIGSARAGSTVVDRYTLRYGRYFTMPLLFIHGSAAQTQRVVVALGPEGKLTAKDWPAIEEHLRRGEAVVTFDYRAQGENAMAYRVRGDDPSLNPGDWRAEYGNPLSSVLADYVYNSIVLGQPYFLQKLEDIEVALTFARKHLMIPDARVEISGDDVMRWGAEAVFGRQVVTPEANETAGSYNAAARGDPVRIDDLMPSVLVQMNRVK
jgi:hypothetical protein